MWSIMATIGMLLLTCCRSQSEGLWQSQSWCLDSVMTTACFKRKKANVLFWPSWPISQNHFHWHMVDFCIYTWSHISHSMTLWVGLDTTIQYAAKYVSWYDSVVSTHLHLISYMHISCFDRFCCILLCEFAEVSMSTTRAHPGKIHTIWRLDILCVTVFSPHIYI